MSFSEESPPSSGRDRLIPFLSTLWLGMIVGVTFLATPVKFLAESLERPVALDVGRVTFWAFSRVEWALGALLVVALWRTARGRRTAHRRWPSRIPVPALVVVAVLGAQGAWLLPELNERVALVLAGEALSPSPAHTLYGALELVKCGALLALAFGSIGAEPSRGGSDQDETGTI